MEAEQKDISRYRIAGHVIGLAGLNQDLETTCAAYRYEGGGLPEAVFAVTEEAFQQECRAWCEENRAEIESYLLAKQFFAWLLDKRGVMLHASAVMVDGRDGFAFIGPSGTGKSTHARLWRQTFGEERVRILNDDKPLLVLREDFWVCGSPWCGKEKLSCDAEAPLRAIVVLHQGKENVMRPLKMEEAIVPLMRQLFLPKEREPMEKALALADQLVRRVPVYELWCDLSEGAARLCYETLKGAIPE